MPEWPLYCKRNSYSQSAHCKRAAQYLLIPLPPVYYLVQGEKIPAIQIGAPGESRNPLWTAKLLSIKTKVNHTVLMVNDDPVLQNANMRKASKRLSTKISADKPLLSTVYWPAASEPKIRRPNFGSTWQCSLSAPVRFLCSPKLPVSRTRKSG